MDAATLARFMAKVHVDPKTGCWLWTAGCSGRPQYRRPQFYVLEDGRWTPRYAYRIAYEHFVGPIPEGLTLDHVKERCAARPMCVNPEHLEPVTQGVNVARGDSFAALNASKTHCDRGHLLQAEIVDARGRRVCTECRRLRGRRRYNDDPIYRERHKAQMRANYANKKKGHQTP